ncbi:hypothetical protein EGO58_11915 [Limosilactobacillus reuteri]|nr:hypothetical protein EGO58_11915 [Limosilactobacillus reuteri]
MITIINHYTFALLKEAKNKVAALLVFDPLATLIRTLAVTFKISNNTRRLIIFNGFQVDLMNILYVLNLFSISRLDSEKYNFNFVNKVCSVYKDYNLVYTGYLCDGLYKIILDYIFF